MRPRDDTKRVALLEATLVEVTEHGFGVASVARIARRARVSPATLYIHFADKDALLEATFVHVCDQPQREQSSCGSIIEAVARNHRRRQTLQYIL